MAAPPQLAEPSRWGALGRRVFRLAGLGFALGCGPSERPAQVGSSEVAIEGLLATRASGLGTVVEVAWSTALPTEGRVCFGADLERQVHSPQDTQHGVLLWGLEPETSYPIRVEAWDGDQRIAEDETLITTGAAPRGWVDLSVSGAETGGFVLTTLIGGASGVVLLSRSGALVWWHEEDREGVLVNRAVWSWDRQAILYSAYQAGAKEGDPAATAEIVRVGLTGEIEEVIPAPGLTHDFTELPDGTLAYLAVDWAEVDGRAVLGHKLVEIPPGGSPVDVFSAWDHLVYDPAQEDPATGWTHANALDHLPEEDAYLVGLRNLHSQVWVDRATRVPDWIFGPAGTLELAAGSSWPHHPHQFERLADGLLVFDNGSSSEQQSRVVEYSLDLAAGQVAERWSYVPDPALYVYALGDVSRLEDGDTLVTWSSAGRIEQLSPAGETVWQIQSAMGVAFGYASFLADLDGG